jgi:hypothetical protein
VLGLGLLALVPLLSLLGVFGPARETAGATGDGLALSVSYPTRLRYFTFSSAQVTVQNVSGQALPELTVEIDRSYLEAFGEVALSPVPETITAEVFEVTFDEVPPGEARVVLISLRAQGLLGHAGQVSAQAEGAGEARVTLRTFVFP